MTSVIAITLMLACGSATDCIEFPTAEGGITRLQPDVKMTLQESDMAEFYLSMNQYDQPNLSMNLHDEAASRLAELTTNHVGEDLAMVVEGKVVTEARIVSPITQGRVQMNPGAGKQPFWEKVPWMMEKLGQVKADDHAATRRNYGLYIGAATALLVGAAAYLLMGRRRKKRA